MSKARDDLIHILKTEYNVPDSKVEAKADNLIAEIIADAKLNEDSDVKLRVKKKAGIK